MSRFSLCLWFLRFCVVLGTLSLHFHLHAQAVPATDATPRVVFPRTTVGNVTTVGAVTADAANAAKFSFGAAANGNVFANTGAALPTAGGGSVAVNVASEIPKAGVAKAIGRFALRVAPTAYVLNAGVALYDLGKELNFLLKNTNGQLVVTKSDPNFCYTAPCQEFAPANGSGVWSQSKPVACASYVIPSGGWTFTGVVDGPQSCRFVNGSGQFNSFGLSARASTPTTNAPQLASSLQQFEDAIAAQAGWPVNSAIARATVDAIKAGESLEVIPKTVTGPATSPGGQIVTNNVTNNTTKTETITHNHTYSPAAPTVTTSTTINTLIVNNTSGVTESNTTSTATTPTPEPAITCGLPGTPACKIDETGTPAAVGETKYDSKLDTYKTDQDAHIAKVGGAADKPIFPGWSSLFVTPPLAACEPYQLPDRGGVSMGAINPCPVVDGVRTFMAWLWGLTAFWWSLKMVRESI